jgi:dTDP-4-amino-4,6-dideoxygalactose transaminase
LKNNKNSIEDFKNSSILEKNIIVLPMHVNINNQQIKFIFNKIKSALK